MSEADREAIRARAREFVGNAAFGRHYEKLHIPARQWFVGQLIRCLSIGRAAHFLDVKIENELLRGHSLCSASEFYFLVDPSPRGLILQVPQVDHAVPSPQATDA